MSPFGLSAKTTLSAFAVLLTAAGGTAVLAAGTGAGAKAPLRCEIQVTPQKGMVTLEGIVFSDRAVDGTYSLQVEGSGRGGSNSVQQGGAFSAKAGRSNSLGQVSLGSAGANYDVTLKVSAGGKTVSCTEWVGGRI
ncbi:curli-like amyloid fiber formation chaperone CsgH [Allorhizobium pseudoryzae]|uniref:curli-like amyloid fiber formation chaperone CsgH n=1 Tax=Allorhizobium pseudoryzae TaxID=379684 RepID=UPI003CFF6298